jgi:hypothetical protein
MRTSLLATASLAAISLAQQSLAAEIIYSTTGAVNTFNATQSGVGNQIGESTTDGGGYIYPWDYNAAQQIGVNNTANVSQNGANNLANFKQGQDNVHVFDEGFEYNFGSITEAYFNTLSLDQMGEDNVELSTKSATTTKRPQLKVAIQTLVRPSNGAAWMCRNPVNSVSKIQPSSSKAISMDLAGTNPPRFFKTAIATMRMLISMRITTV